MTMPPEIASMGLKYLDQRLSSLYVKLCDIANDLKIPDTFYGIAGTTQGGVGAYDAAHDTFMLPSSCRRVDVTLFDNNAIVQFDNNKAGPQDSFNTFEMEYIAPGFYSFPYMANRVRIRAKDTAKQARYQMVMWT